MSEVPIPLLFELWKGGGSDWLGRTLLETRETQGESARACPLSLALSLSLCLDSLVIRTQDPSSE